MLCCFALWLSSSGSSALAAIWLYIRKAADAVFTLPCSVSSDQSCVQVEVRRFWAGKLVEQVPVVDMLLLLQIATQDIAHEDLFVSTSFMCL